jgi:hypothetical protein
MSRATAEELPVHEIELIGLDGRNLLAYLAALGTLRVLTLAEPRARVLMSWVEKEWWTPVIHHSRIGTGEELIAALAERVCGEASVNAAWEIGEDLTLSCAEFREHLGASALEATSATREVADYMAAFGSDVFGTGSKKEQMSDTEFRTMSGAGHQHFLGFMREISRGSDAEHLHRTLLEHWNYADSRPSLRWDPSDFRPHALRAGNPSSDPIKTMRGANRLAVESLPMFPTVPVRGRVDTVGFRDRNRETQITWPIWADLLDQRTVGALLASREVQDAERSAMIQRGIVQVFRARRFTEGKYRNFSPAMALL